MRVLYLTITAILIGASGVWAEQPLFRVVPDIKQAISPLPTKEQIEKWKPYNMRCTEEFPCTSLTQSEAFLTAFASGCKMSGGKNQDYEWYCPDWLNWVKKIRAKYKCTSRDGIVSCQDEVP